MGVTFTQHVTNRMRWLDDIAEKVQPKVQEIVNEGGAPLRNVLDGTLIGTPLHPALTDVPIGSWTAALVFDGLDLVSGSKAMRNAADAALAFGTAGGYLAAVVGLSDWRYLSGGSRRMGVAHGLLNVAGLALSTASVVARAAGKRNAGRLLLLGGYSFSGMGAHLGGELSYGYGLRVNRNVFEAPGPDEFVAVLSEDELPEGGMRRVEAGGAGILLSRTSDGGIHAIAASCNHFSGPLQDGAREGDTVVCPWHWSRFDLRTGEALEGPAVFPQAIYQTRVRDGNIEVMAHPENVQKLVR